MSEIAQTRHAGALRGFIGFDLRLAYHQIAGAAAILECVVVVAAAVIGSAAYHFATTRNPGDLEVALGVGLVDALIYTFLARSAGFYRIPVLLDPERHLRKVLLAWASVFLLIPMVLFLLKVGQDFSRGTVLTFAALGLCLLVMLRLGISRYLAASITRGGVGGRRAVVVAERDELASLSTTQLLQRFGAEEVGRVTLAPRDDVPGLSRDVVGEIDRAVRLAHETAAEEFVVAVQWSSTALLELVRERLRFSALPVRLLPDRVVRDVIGQRKISGPAFSVDIQRAPLSAAERLAKRAFDVVVASTVILLLLPLLALMVIAVKLDSPGPVIFRQRRNGFDGRPFVIYKFRSMTTLEDGPLIPQARPGDRRVTHLGRLLRRYSIDELPQLFNVLKGDMSLIGPRPHALAHDDVYGSLIANYAFRHHVRPGITGWAQVNGYRGETHRLEQMQQRVELDLWYINNWSPWLDLRILLGTCFQVVGNPAY